MWCDSLTYHWPGLSSFTSAYRALISEWPAHKKLAKLTWPIWLYVAVTGVVVYWMISP
jgi:putative membrane protein